MLIDHINATLKGIEFRAPQLSDEAQRVAASTTQGLLFLRGYLSDQGLCRLDQPSSAAPREPQPVHESTEPLADDHADGPKGCLQFPQSDSASS